MKKYTGSTIQEKELFDRLLMIEWRLSAIRTMIENRRKGFYIAAQISSTLHALEDVAEEIRCKFADDCSSVETLIWQMDDELTREELLRIII